MRYCPKCGAEYRPGFTECSDCLVALVDERPEGPLSAPGVDDFDEDGFDQTLVPNLVQVYAADRMQADMVRSVLEGSGIPAVLGREGYSAAYPLTVGALGEGRVLVREEDRERALEAIRDLVSGEVEFAEPELEDDEDPGFEVGDTGVGYTGAEEEPWRRPTWFLVLAALLAIGAILAVVTSSLPDLF